MGWVNAELRRVATAAHASQTLEGKMSCKRIVAIAGLFLIIYLAFSVMPERAQTQVVVDLRKDAAAIGDAKLR